MGGDEGEGRIRDAFQIRTNTVGYLSADVMLSVVSGNPNKAIVVTIAPTVVARLGTRHLRGVGLRGAGWPYTIEGSILGERYPFLAFL